MDDLSRLLVQQPQPGARFGQGTLREWDPATFEHVIEWRGLRITGATILAGVDALTWQPGDQVLLLGADQSGRRGWTDWMVLGRAITPGPGAGEQAIDWMRSSLVRLLVDDIVQELIGSPAGATLIRGLIGQASAQAFVAGQVSTSSTSWQNLGGPSVTVDVGDSGRALVEFGAVVTTSPGEHAAMSFQVSGATSQPPSGARSIQQQTDASTAIVTTQSAAVLVTGLNPGTHTFAARYTTFLTTGSGFWSNRYLIVTPY